MKRFSSDGAPMREDDAGGYVRFEDHMALVNAIQRRFESKLNRAETRNYELTRELMALVGENKHQRTKRETKEEEE